MNERFFKEVIVVVVDINWFVGYNSYVNCLLIKEVYYLRLNFESKLLKYGSIKNFKMSFVYI